MDCSNIAELLSEYIDGMLDDEQKAAVEKHIEACSKCREEYEMLSSIINSCHQIEDIDLPDDFHQKLHDKLIMESMAVKKPGMSSRFKRSLTAVAAVLILAVSISSAVNSGILNIGSKKESNSVQENASARYDAAAGQSMKKEAPAAPQAQFSIKAAENKEMKTGSAPQAGIQSFDSASRQRMQYSLLDINLSQDEYKKYNEIIKNTLESFGGYPKQDGSSSYIMPEKSLDDFIKKLRDGYNINNIQTRSIDITEEYSRLQGEIAELQAKAENTGAGDSNKTMDNTDDSSNLIDKKRNELNELDSKAGNIFIQINITSK